ncbi:hypothetical protein [Microcoleus sp. OTE_8_concoct_300]|uniref:hypothetical protein n=1 Tax=Microcoleus sp. OTE_8_concoct_300 TaxID=2964710 RepID=UPI00403F986E
MPRTKKQFSFLNRALKVAGGTPTPGSTLDNYLKFKTGVNKRNAGKIPADARKLVTYSAVPFGGPDADKATSADKRYRISLSKFSNDWRGGAGAISKAEIGYDTIDPLNKTDSTYYPAQMKVFVPDGGAAAVATAKVSGITKRSYKSKAGKSYTLPFGAVVTKTTQNEYREQMSILGDKAKVAGATSVTFVPEEWTSPTREAVAGT